MKAMNNLPNVNSIVRYLGGYTEDTCDLIVGQEYKVNSKNTFQNGVEYASITMNEDDVWYIKGHGDETNDFDKFEVVENYLTREELLALKDKHELALQTILNDSNEMLESYVEESGVVYIRNTAKEALE